jgi:phthalate 4,5-cis-dihydrodiol dehydrogenase
MADASEGGLRLGVAGLGRAFSVMLPTFIADPRVTLVAGTDLRPEARRQFAADFAARSYPTIEELCADPNVEAVYVATPHQHHVQHATLAAQRGKHLLIEKPMALTLDECRTIVDAARRSGVHVVVGHSHSFDAPIQRMPDLIARGDFGRVRMINAINYTDYLYRPRRPEELDTGQGGGAVFNQAAHQVDIVRLIAGGRVETVRAVTGSWDARRATEGAYAALLTFENGAFASLTYNGYGHFDSDEFQDWVGEMGERKTPYAKSRRRFENVDDEIAFKNARNYGGADFKSLCGHAVAHQNFGTLLVSCERADLRALPNGIMIYQDGSARLDAPPPPTVPRGGVIDELYQAIVSGKAPLHDGAWATATVEVLLAMLRSAREGSDVRLSHQGALA